MIAAMNIQRFNAENIYLCKPIKNKVMPGGLFSRIIYSQESDSMNGIYLTFEMYGGVTEIYPSKFKFQFVSGTGGTGGTRHGGMESDTSVIQAICTIERNILSVLDGSGKTSQHKLQEQLAQNNFKFFLLSNTLEHEKTNGSRKYVSAGAGGSTNNTNNKPITTDTYTVCTTPTRQSSSSPIRFILKISGIWSTSTTYGITYKFSRVTTNV